MLELLVRGAAVGVFVLLSLRMAGDRTPARVTGALFCLGAAGHTITQCPIAFRALGLGAAPAWALSVMAAGLFWAFALELFGDNSRLAPARLAPAAALLAIGALAMIAPPATARSLWLAHNIVGAALMVHILFVVWTGWRGDLVEARRRLRGPLLGVAALYTLIVVSVQSAELFSRPAAELSMLAALSLLAMSLAGGVMFLRADTQLFGAPAGRSSVRPIETKDRPLLDRLNAALDADELWREEGLTIGALAARLGAPEHHLRRLINEGLGYRNFAAFINERRIGAAKLALGDAAKARVTIATVAYDVGFSSLGPFNRAFREATGQTPTAWRRAAQAGWAIPEAG
jgi:AraC-like DNA-binding protein